MAKLMGLHHLHVLEFVPMYIGYLIVNFQGHLLSVHQKASYVKMLFNRMVILETYYLCLRRFCIKSLALSSTISISVCEQPETILSNI